MEEVHAEEREGQPYWVYEHTTQVNIHSTAVPVLCYSMGNTPYGWGAFDSAWDHSGCSAVYRAKRIEMGNRIDPTVQTVMSMGMLHTLWCPMVH